MNQFEETIGALGDTTEMIFETLFEEPGQPIDYMQLTDLASMSQQYLQELGVSGPKIDKAVELCMVRGIHAKITGSGGNGGCLIGFYIPSEDFSIAELEKELDAEGFSIEHAEIDYQGTQVVIE